MISIIYLPSMLYNISQSALLSYPRLYIIDLYRSYSIIADYNWTPSSRLLLATAICLQWASAINPRVGLRKSKTQMKKVYKFGHKSKETTSSPPYKLLNKFSLACILIKKAKFSLVSAFIVYHFTYIFIILLNF